MTAVDAALVSKKLSSQSEMNDNSIKENQH